ncbi:MAG: AhpC/TSA family protein [Saprospiraceae bacterium]|nr:AhpC/TSA family protein [Saprospiraceae bacterium]
MKVIRFTSFTFVFIFLVSGVFAQVDSCHIRFYIEGINAGKVKLIGSFADQNYLADSTVADKSGYFEFKRKSPLKPGYFFVILPDYSNIHFMIDHNDQFMTVRTKKSDLYNSAKVEGSINTELLYQSIRMQVKQESLLDSLNKTLSGRLPNDPIYISSKAEIQKLADERNEHINFIKRNHPKEFYTKFKLAGQNPEIVDVRKLNGDLDTLGQMNLFREQFWDNFDFKDERLLYTPVIVNKLKMHIVDLTVQHPDSIIRQADIIVKKSLVNYEMFKFVSNWLVIKYQPTKTKVMDGEAVFVHVIDKYFTKEYATWYNDKELADVRKKADEMKASLLNRIGPDVISIGPNGETRSIYEIKSPYIIVYMYDTKCEHCQAETPLLRKWHDEWKSKGVEVFAILLNSSEQEWKDFMVQNRMEVFSNVRDPSNRSIYGKYYVDITPELYVLNPERKIIGKNLKVEQITTVIERDMKINRK